MNIFDELKNRVNSINNNLGRIIVEAMVAEESAIVDLNVSQLEEGINAEGTTVGEYASNEYAQFKQSIGSKAPLGIVDTKLEGDFHSGFYSEPYIGSNIDASGLFINSRDGKTDKLENAYPGLFGIAPNNADELQELTLPQITNTIKNELTKK